MPELQPCGTYAAEQRHRRNGEPVCDACKEAAAAYKRELYSKRPLMRHNNKRLGRARREAIRELIANHQEEYEELYDRALYESSKKETREEW